MIRRGGSPIIPIKNAASEAKPAEQAAGKKPAGSPAEGTNPVAQGSLGPSKGKTPEQLQDAGKRLVEGIEDAIRKGGGDKDVENIESKYFLDRRLRQPYPEYIQRHVLDPPGPAPVKFADQHDIKYTDYSVMSKAGSETRRGPLFLKAMVSNENGIIIKFEKFADQDHTQKIDGRMYISDLQFQLWKDASPSDNGLKNLKVYVEVDIVNPETERAIEAAHARHGIMENGDSASWKPGSAEFNEFMGGDNGRPLARMLQDHHKALGDKKVIEIRTIHDLSPAIAFYLG